VTKYLQLMEQAEQYITEERPKLDGPADVARFMRPLLKDAEQEMFYVLHMNSKSCLVYCQLTTVGLADRANVHAREIFREAIVRNASRVILCHNHPTGDPTPSHADISSTKDLIAAGEIIGIKVMDHVVIGKRTETRIKDYVSFREETLL